MNKICFFRICLLAAVFMAALSPAHAAPIVTPLNPQAKPSPFLPIAEQLGQQLQTLVGGAAPNANSDNNDESNAEPAPTFGSRALTLVMTAGNLLRMQAKMYVTNFAALPQLSGWFDLQTSNPHLRSLWISIGDDLISVVGISLLGALALELLLYPVRRKVRTREMHNRRGGRFVTLFALFVLRALPVMVFIGASVTLLDQNETQKFPRFIIVNVVSALAMSRVIISLVRGLLAPNNATLRFVPLTDRQAVYGYRWLGAFSLIIIFGYFFVDVTRAAHMPAAAITAFTNILGLILIMMAIVVIAQKRAFVATLLRGDLSAAQRDLSWLAWLRLWLARFWHILAIAYLIIGYAVAALGVENGFGLMLRGTIVTLLVLTIMRLLFGAIDRWGARDTAPGAAMHHAVLRFLMRAVLWALAVIGIVAGWGADIAALATTPFGQRLLGSVFSISVTVIVLGLIYEIFSARIERHLSRRDDEKEEFKLSARARTLLPMIRNAVFVVFAGIVGLMALSEAGFNIGPLLAGAGIVGVAVGFGAQTLVKDFLTGLFIVIENSIAIGDVVKIADHAGVVEAMSIRTLRLRDQDGGLHILPFSEVTKIVNMTRDFAYAFISVNVPYSTDLERAMNVIRSVGDDLQKDPVYKRVILEPVEIWGVDQLGETSATLVARMRTRPGKQWDVKRRFLLKLRQSFDKEGIAMPSLVALKAPDAKPAN